MRVSVEPATEPEHHHEGPRDLAEALGGAHGLADSSLPGLAFVIAYTVSGNELEPSIVSALAVAFALTVVRLARRETLQFAFAGLVGVGIAAFIASRTGRAEDFFLPGLLFNAAYALGYAISIWMRWPLIGVLAGPLVGEGMEWRKDPERVAVYARASWIWVGVFALRLAVQLPLYLGGLGGRPGDSEGGDGRADLHRRDLGDVSGAEGGRRDRPPPPEGGRAGGLAAAVAVQALGDTKL